MRNSVMFVAAAVLVAACSDDGGNGDKDQGVETIGIVDLWPQQPDLLPQPDQLPWPDGMQLPDVGPPPDGQPPPPDQGPPPPDQGPACGSDADCDDGIPCTTNKCVNSACENTVNPNFCAIGGNCVAIDTINPNNVCQKCLPTEDPWAWSNYVCTTLVAGTGQIGATDGTTTIARFYYPSGVDVGPSSEIYVADYNNHRVRMIAGGNVTTLAGSSAGYADGPAATAKFNNPFDVAVGPGGEVYVADYDNNRIRMIQNGQVTTFAGSTQGYADGLAATAKLNRPIGLAVGPSGEVYVADYINHRIRMISGGQVTTLAGDGVAAFQDGPAATARFHYPAGVAVGDGGEVYVADRYNHRIRMIKNGQVSTVAGNGSTTLLYYPTNVVADSSGVLYVADEYHHRIRKVDGANLTDFAGSGTAGYGNSPSLDVRFNRPWGLALAGTALIVGDRYNHRIRRVSW